MSHTSTTGKGPRPWSRALEGVLCPEEVLALSHHRATQRQSPGERSLLGPVVKMLGRGKLRCLRKPQKCWVPYNGLQILCSGLVPRAGKPSVDTELPWLLACVLSLSLGALLSASKGSLVPTTALRFESWFPPNIQLLDYSLNVPLYEPPRPCCPYLAYDQHILRRVILSLRFIFLRLFIHCLMFALRPTDIANCLKTRIGPSALPGGPALAHSSHHLSLLSNLNINTKPSSSAANGMGPQNLAEFSRTEG